ncbi:M18 family aminopeptidase [Rhodococcus sp. HNM0563]|uniref:M18 family aminopeptidase n=1 Tax=unclassified Rhodococcus (in: high G+C Gram-positive bacteria) TaxID=192944 RepID=UPI00146B4064|nr:MULTISPECIES: M18 family aminopeptidase [unclassified Rhodococcus (in: high G+C Gram-positive bacteria)]MCK0089334.1 M18 family aminopeptidase [Rhodococcus sp. F64268]NLU62861.1 M18 family aminopeptidase [Rhodococcus sp. HNM0563]
MPSITHADAQGLCNFVDLSPSPFHVCATVAATLTDNGFTELDETSGWPADPGRYYVIRGGSLIAWSTEGDEPSPARPFRIVGGHTDSPNLRVKQHPDLASAGWQLVGLEPYGGAWLNSWLDRDLGVSGRFTVRSGHTTEDVLVCVDKPVLRVPQLAIHLSEDRKGVQLDPQRHVNGVWGIGGEPRSFIEYLAEQTGIDASAVLGWELMTHDLAPSSLVGAAGELVSAPRLDNQATCYAGLQALLAATEHVAEHAGPMPVLALFDHEEVGSMSDRGAFSDLLNTVLERIVLVRGGGRDEFLRALAGSIVASGDMAHATHPNYPDRHEPAHRIAVGGGPVLKVNQNLRYATDAEGAGAFALACEQAGVPLQRYVHRADLPCGSTIGPITASRTGLTTVDVGAPQLAMHSARELMGAADVAMYADSLAAFLTPRLPHS